MRYIIIPLVIIGYIYSWVIAIKERRNANKKVYRMNDFADQWIPFNAWSFIIIFIIFAIKFIYVYW